MIVSIHQPSFWPWLGLLDKIAKSDTYVILDDVAASRDANQYRNTFLVQGSPKYLTLPTDYKMGRLIRDLRFRDDRWIDDHLTKLRSYYQRAPQFASMFPRVEALYRHPHGSVLSLVVATMRFSVELLGIPAHIVHSSELEGIGSKADRVLDLCLKTGADTYLSGTGARDYMADALPRFEAAGIQVIWQRFSHPIYEQPLGTCFVPGLACLDLFFFLEQEHARALFWKNVEATKEVST